MTMAAASALWRWSARCWAYAAAMAATAYAAPCCWRATLALCAPTKICPPSCGGRGGRAASQCRWLHGDADPPHEQGAGLLRCVPFGAMVRVDGGRPTSRGRPPCTRSAAGQKRNEAPKPPTRGAWVREHVANGTGRRHCRPAPAQGSRPLRIPFGGTAHVFPRLLSPKTPQAAGPCSWACRRLPAPSPHSERNAERPPPARGVGVRLPGANGTGRRHCRPRT